MADKNQAQVTSPTEDGDAFLNFLVKYKTVILAALLGTSAIFLYRVAETNRFEMKSRAASSELSKAGDNIMMLQAVLDEFGEEAIAPIARLKLAQAYFAASNFQMAETTYDDFLSKHTDHDLTPAAVLGKAHCLEGRGEYSAAVVAFDRFLENHAEAVYLTPQAVLGKARSLTSAGALNEARTVYEDFVAASEENTQWTVTAQQAMDELDVKIERAKAAEGDAAEASAAPAEEPAAGTDETPTDSAAASSN